MYANMFYVLLQIKWSVEKGFETGSGQTKKAIRSSLLAKMKILLKSFLLLPGDQQKKTTEPGICLLGIMHACFVTDTLFCTLCALLLVYGHQKLYFIFSL